MQHHHPRGFTLVELLVVIAVIGILMSLILPAVQQAREAARKTQCKDHIRQLVVALHLYHESHAAFPINYGNGPYDDSNTGASWMQLILPHVEQGNLHARIRFGQPLSDPENTAVAQTPVPVFHCPSDTHAGTMDFRSNVPGTWAVTNYKACAGSNWEWGPFAPQSSTRGRYANHVDGLDHGNGLICRGGGNQPTPTRMADLSDGSGTTFALGESVPEWCRHTWWYWFNATTATCAIPLNYKAEPDLQVAMEGDWWHNYSFLSRHYGGAHFALADGAVRFVSDNINRDIYHWMATIQGGEPIGGL